MTACKHSTCQPGGVQIRAAGLDEATARTGSAHEYLEIPDAKKARLSLTSLILADGLAGSDVFMPSDASAARRQFQRGGILQYFCLVQNSAAKRHPADIGAQLRVVRDDKQVLLLPVRVERLADDKQAVSGQLNLSAMPAGDYFVQVIAAGRGAGK